MFSSTLISVIMMLPNLALNLADYSGFEKEKQSLLQKGKLRGIGFQHMKHVELLHQAAVMSLGAGVGL